MNSWKRRTLIPAIALVAALAGNGRSLESQDQLAHGGGTMVWAVGASGTILHSADGVIWTAQSSGTANTLSGVFFADSLHGWAVGDSGTILHTSDGGGTWEAQSSGTSSNLRDVRFIDSLNGWAIGGEVLRTTDGGASWTVESGSPGGFGIFFINGTTGWAATSQSDTIYESTDGGVTWVGQAGTGVFDGMRDLTFVDATTGWAVGIGGGILHTTDGTTWHAQAPPPDFPGGEFWGVSFPTASIGWAVGYYGVIAHTKTGGATWMSQASGTAFNLLDVVALDTRRAWAVGAHGTILATKNGHSWSAQSSGTTADLLGVSVPRGGVSTSISAMASADGPAGSGGVCGLLGVEWILGFGALFLRRIRAR